MRRHCRSLPLLAVLLLAAGMLAPSLSAQQARRELRGVWLTTLLGLDWPAASLRGNPPAQQQALQEILDDLKARNFNTVFFQVRSRGNAMYRSAFEPWASELTGTLGADPGWDPLDFAIREAHARGMALHAWFNVCRVWSRGTPPRSTPLHIVRAHPDWVQRFGDDMWIDPGIPEAREFTVRVMEDLVRKYPIDGIHLDYIRYPDRGFKDDDSWLRSGRRGSRDDWRRDNVSLLVQAAYERLTAIRPSLQVGSAPIGIYRNITGARGWEGRNAIFQDSRRWLREGYHDYVVPQIYWGLTRRGSRIDFEALVTDWKTNASGRHVYAGIAAYKKGVHPWLHEHIDACRELGADGSVFFRYEHIRGNTFGGRFNDLRLPPPLSWRDRLRPNPPLSVRVDERAVHWEEPVPAADGDRASWYALYGFRGTDDGRGVLIDVLPGDARTADRRDGYAQYAVTALDAFFNESGAAREGAGVALAEAEVESTEISAPSIAVPGPGISRPQRSGDLVLLGYELQRDAYVRLRLMNSTGAEVLVLVDGMRTAGTHVLGIERSRLPEDIRRYIFEAGDIRYVMDFAPDS